MMEKHSRVKKGELVSGEETVSPDYHISDSC